MSIAKIYLRQYSNVINVLVKNNDDALGESNELLKQNIKELNDENIMGLKRGMGDPVYLSQIRKTFFILSQEYTKTQ